MACWALEALLHKYANPKTKEDQFIKRTLEDIVQLHTECDKAEYYYADTITRHFCRLIELLEKKQKTASLPQTGQLPFRNGDELIRAFYNHFKTEAQVDYWEIDRALYNDQQGLVNPTLKDYAARIRTFCSCRYLGAMFPQEQLEDRDPILFAYENLELILATFKTRDDNGQIVKQRVNIRSALRKLNQFKQECSAQSPR